MEKFDAIHRLTEQIAPDKIELALTAADVPRIAAKGKKVALIGIENAYPLGTDIKRVKEFYDRGGRYMSLAHNGHSQLADSNTGERDGQWMHDGLSDFGRQVIVEMNRLGIMVDISHPSKNANLQAIELSKAPVIASHSAARALADVSRNLDDEQLNAVKRNGGVVQTVGVCELRESDQARLTGAGRGHRGAAQGVWAWDWWARWDWWRRAGEGRRRRTRRTEPPDAGTARSIRRAHGGDRQEDAGRSESDGEGLRRITSTTW